MAYHYAYNERTGEQRRILTSSLDTYRGAIGWKVFDSEDERAANIPPTWYRISYSQNRRAEQVSPHDARAYWTVEHMRAGWALFTSAAEANAALTAMPRSFAINPETGETKMRAMWMPEELRGPVMAGYIGDFPSIQAARDAHPAPFVCLHPNGNEDTCYPQQRRNYMNDGYIVEATKEECIAKLPVRWSWDDSRERYYRVYSGSVMTRPSAFANLRRALVALKRGNMIFEDRRGRSVAVLGVLGEAQTMCAMRETTLSRFIERVNTLCGDALLHLCPDCSHNMIAQFSQQAGGRRICSGCASDYVPCASCNLLFPQDETQEGRGGNTYCRAHWQPVPNANANGELMQYSADVTRSRLSFLKGTGEVMRPNTLWLGWELECHPKGSIGGGNGHDPDCDTCGGSGEYEDGDGDERDCDCEGPSGDVMSAVRRVAAEAGEWAICKSDSSLDDGLEIVSVPATLSWHALNVPQFLQTAQTYLSGWPHNDCGIHVHVGRKQLSALTLGKVLCFMHHPDNQAFVTLVAGREPISYCMRGGIKKLTCERDERSLGRYQAVNLNTRGNKTVEFRIFRSNVSPAGFMKNLEYVHAICTWAREAAPANEKLLRVPAFVHWVKRNRALYPMLVRFFESNGTLPKPNHHIDYTPSIVLAA